MRLLFSKRGDMNELILNNLFTLVLLTILATLTGVFVNDFSHNTFMERQFLSKDIALTIDTLLISPNKVIIYYPDEISEFQVSILKEKGKAKVSYIEDKKLKYPTTHFFIPFPAISINNFEYPIEENIEKIEPYSLVFTNDKKDIRLYEGRAYLTNDPIIDKKDISEYDVDESTITKIENWRNDAKTYIDVPSSKQNGPYSDLKDIYECTAVEIIYLGILYTELSKDNICDDKDIDSRINDMKNSNLTIILRKSIEDKEINKAKIYYNSNTKSKKFASILGNNLLKKGVEKDNIIIEEISSGFQEENKIMGTKAGILFFSGNIDSDLGGLIQSSSAMNNAIREYYEN